MSHLIWDHVSTKKYIISCYEIKRYFVEKLNPPNKIMIEHRKALLHYRMFLDHEGFKIPKPKIKYDIKDTRTWKYLSIQVEKSKFVREVINPNYPK